MPSKSIFKSKTFWLNVLTATAGVSGALSGVVAPGTLTAVAAVANVAVRLITDEPVHVTTPTPE